MRLALNKVQITQALQCCWHCQNSLRDEPLLTNAYNRNHYKKIQSLIAEGELPEPTTLRGWVKWSPDILRPPQYEHTISATVQYLPIMQVVAVKRLTCIGPDARDSIISAEVYAKVSDDENLMLEAYMWGIIQFSDNQQYSTQCIIDKSLNFLKLIPSTNPLQPFSQCTDTEVDPQQGENLTNEVFKEVVKPALLQHGNLAMAMTTVFDSPVPDGPKHLLKSSLPDYFSFLPEQFVIVRPTEALGKSPLENFQLPEHYYIVLHMTDISGSGEITYFLVMKTLGLEKCNVTLFLVFIEYREYKELQLTQGRLNCSLQVVDGVEFEETPEGKPKVNKFISEKESIHPYPLTKVEPMVQEAVSKMMKNKGFSSLHSLSILVNLSR